MRIAACLLFALSLAELAEAADLEPLQQEPRVTRQILETVGTDPFPIQNGTRVRLELGDLHEKNYRCWINVIAACDGPKAMLIDSDAALRSQRCLADRNLQVVMTVTSGGTIVRRTTAMVDTPDGPDDFDPSSDSILILTYYECQFWALQFKGGNMNAVIGPVEDAVVELEFTFDDEPNAPIVLQFFMVSSDPELLGP